MGGETLPYLGVKFPLQLRYLLEEHLLQSWRSEAVARRPIFAGGRTPCPGCWLSVLHSGSFHEDQVRDGEFTLILGVSWFSFVVRRWCIYWIRSSLKLALICVSFKIYINYGWLSWFMSLLGFCPFLVHNESLHNCCCILKSLRWANVLNRPRSHQICNMTKTPIKFFCGENQKIFHRGSKSMKILLRCIKSSKIQKKTTIISWTYIPNLQHTIQPYHRQ